MLSRAFTKPRKSPRDGDQGSSRSQSMDESDQYSIVGFPDDLPLVFCNHRHCSQRNPTLREALGCSVGVMGESFLGISEKVVLLEGRQVYAMKRFRKVTVKGKEFGKRIERLAQVSRNSEYLVPLCAYLYAKRIKFVLCDYYPMGSLADLLDGTRKQGHTSLDWSQRLNIILHIARAIAFIHSQSSTNEKHLQMNVHGNIKASNVMININFTACLSDYGFTQLAERVEVSDTGQRITPPSSPLLPADTYSDKLSQKCDIYNFGVIILDMLGGPKPLKHCVLERKEDIKEGVLEFFEFFVEGKDRKQAVHVLDIALACLNRLSEDRPTIEQILLYLGNVISNPYMFDFM